MVILICGDGTSFGQKLEILSKNFQNKIKPTRDDGGCDTT